MSNATDSTKTRRGDLIVVELRSSYTMSSFKSVEVMEYRLMVVTNLTRAGEIKMVRDDRYGYAGTPQKFGGMLHRTGRFWRLPASSWNVDEAQKIAGAHVYPNSTTPQCFPSLEAARKALGPARLDIARVA